jgi:hypothetical protein
MREEFSIPSRFAFALPAHCVSSSHVAQRASSPSLPPAHPSDQQEAAFTSITDRTSPVTENSQCHLSKAATTMGRFLR